MVLTIIACFILILAIYTLVTGFRAAFRKDMLSVVSRLSLSTAFFILSAALFLGFITLKGYRAFNYEQLAATVHIEPIEKGLFYAHFTYPDAKEITYKIYGEALYVDAQILKWKPIANFIGIHTSYILARVGGRYHTVMDELNKERTVFPLTKDNEMDLFNLRRQFSQLSFLVDAEYGSASFVPVKEGYYALKVSTTGLLFREVANPQANQ